MRGLLCSCVVKLAPFVALVAGCTADATQPLNRYTGHPEAADQGSATINQGHGTTAAGTGDAKGVGFGDSAPSPYVPRFRDYAAYSWVDRGGAQWWSQTLLSFDGDVVFDRVCPIDERQGILWQQCERWSAGTATGDLGIGLYEISGLGAFVFTNATTGKPTLVQTALSFDGRIRKGRLCPIDDKRIDMRQCSAWDRLESTSLELGVKGQGVFRDQDTYVFRDKNGAETFASRLLSGNGQWAWAETCSALTHVLEPTERGCRWEGSIPVSTFGLYGADAVSGVGAAVYVNSGRQVFAETAISMDGTKAARRDCLLDRSMKRVDERSCSPWSYLTLAKVLGDKSML